MNAITATRPTKRVAIVQDIHLPAEAVKQKYDRQRGITFPPLKYPLQLGKLVPWDHENELVEHDG